MSTTPIKVPPSVAKASREELEKLVVGTLQKLKARDKRILELEKTVEHGNEGNTSALEKGMETKLASMQEVQLNAEKKYQERLSAETELLTSKLSLAENEIENKRQMIKELKDQLKTSAAAKANTAVEEKQREFMVKIETLEKQLAEKNSEIESLRNGFVEKMEEIRKENEGDVAQLKEKENELTRAADSAKAEVLQIRKEVENERMRFKRALGELKRRLDVLQKENEGLCSDLTESKASSSQMRQRLINLEREAETATAELKDYKSRAHALLKAKEIQIQEAKALAMEEYATALEEYQEAAASAQALAAEAEAEIMKIKTETSQKIEEMQVRHDEEVNRVKQDTVAAQELAVASTRQYEQLKIRYESLELRVKLLSEQHAEALSAVEEVKLLKSRLASVTEHHEEEMAVSKKTLAANEAELLGARENCILLKEEITMLQGVIAGLQSQAQAQAHPAVTKEENNLASGGGVNGGDDEQMIEIASALRRRTSELEQEVDDLERELQLRSVQEGALKEAVRDLQRELERVKISGKPVDMEYFKNVMLKLFETGEEESLLPVVAAVLQFSPAELTRCKTALEERSRHRALLLSNEEDATGVRPYLNWLGFSGRSN